MWCVYSNAQYSMMTSGTNENANNDAVCFATTIDDVTNKKGGPHLQHNGSIDRKWTRRAIIVSWTEDPMAFWEGWCTTTHRHRWIDPSIYHQPRCAFTRPPIENHRKVTDPTSRDASWSYRSYCKHSQDCVSGTHTVDHKQDKKLSPRDNGEIATKVWQWKDGMSRQLLGPFPWAHWARNIEWSSGGFSSCTICIRSDVGVSKALCDERIFVDANTPQCTYELIQTPKPSHYRIRT